MLPEKKRKVQTFFMRFLTHSKPFKTIFFSLKYPKPFLAMFGLVAPISPPRNNGSSIIVKSLNEAYRCLLDIVSYGKRLKYFLGLKFSRCPYNTFLENPTFKGSQGNDSNYFHRRHKISLQISPSSLWTLDTLLYHLLTNIGMFQSTDHSRTLL